MANEIEEFDALRKLLALKRHEVPPPGYFDRLPREIHVRLAAARQPQARPERRANPGPNWLARLLSLAETQPVFLGSLGVAVCGLVLSGIVYSHRRVETATPILPELVKSAPPMQTLGDLQNLPTHEGSSTNPVLPYSPAGLRFDGSWLNAAPASTPPVGR